MTQPKEPANGSKSDQNIIFLFETIVYFFVQGNNTGPNWPGVLGRLVFLGKKSPKIC